MNRLPDDNDGCGFWFLLIIFGIGMYLIGVALEIAAHAH
jgi:hypothetical protein